MKEGYYTLQAEVLISLSLVNREMEVPVHTHTHTQVPSQIIEDIQEFQIFFL
jgi:hypothetical protein